MHYNTAHVLYRLFCAEAIEKIFIYLGRVHNLLVIIPTEQFSVLSRTEVEWKKHWVVGGGGEPVMSDPYQNYRVI